MQATEHCGWAEGPLQTKTNERNSMRQLASQARATVASCEDAVGQERPGPVTVYELALYRLRAAGLIGGRAPESLSGADFARVGLEILGGCEICGASIAAYNGCPSRSGYWRCSSGCIADQGYAGAEEADQALLDEPQSSGSDVRGVLGSGVESSACEEVRHPTRHAGSSAKRFELLGGPGGYLSCLPMGDARRHDRYRCWSTLLRVNRPMTEALVDCAQRWALRTYDC
jgi:hypothetical protein